MTEEEARTKWCPHVKIIKFENTLYNSRGEYWTSGLPNLCIASDCMMWTRICIMESTFKGVSINPTKKNEGRCGLINHT